MTTLTLGRKGGFGLGTLTLTKGGVPGPYPAPSGYRWDYVVENSQVGTESGVAVVELKRIAA